jgi:hypothetical protein
MSYETIVSRIFLKFRDSCWCPTHDLKKSIPAVLSAVAEMLDLRRNSEGVYFVGHINDQ